LEHVFFQISQATSFEPAATSFRGSPTAIDPFVRRHIKVPTDGRLNLPIIRRAGGAMFKVTIIEGKMFGIILSDDWKRNR